MSAGNNSSSKKILMVTMIFLVSFTLFRYFNNKGKFEELPELVDMKKLTTEDYLEDFDYLYQNLEESYPYFQMENKGEKLDWLSNYDNYKARIEKTNSDEEFLEEISKILLDLKEDTIELVPYEDGIKYYYTYKNSPNFDWRNKMAKTFEKKEVQNRYEITNEKLKNFESNLKGVNGTKNSISKDLVPGEIGYIKIKQMLTPNSRYEIFKRDEEDITNYLKDIKDYPILVLDIRGNPGGNLEYWSQFLLPKIVDKEYSMKNYIFTRDSQLLDDYNRQLNVKKITKTDLNNFNFPEETLNIVNQLDLYTDINLEINPDKDSIGYKGKIYLLIDEEITSSSELLAKFIQDNGIGILVGTETKGDSLKSDDYLIGLPNTGYVIKFSKDVGVLEDGSISRFSNTKPDIEVLKGAAQVENNSPDFIDIKGDEMIRKILELENDI